MALGTVNDYHGDYYGNEVIKDLPYMDVKGLSLDELKKNALDVAMKRAGDKLGFEYEG